MDKKELSAERIVILDAGEGKVYVRFVPTSMIEEDGDDVLEFLIEKELGQYGVRASDCTYMLVNGDDFINDNTN